MIELADKDFCDFTTILTLVFINGHFPLTCHFCPTLGAGHLVAGNASHMWDFRSTGRADACAGWPQALSSHPAAATSAASSLTSSLHIHLLLSCKSSTLSLIALKRFPPPQSWSRPQMMIPIFFMSNSLGRCLIGLFLARFILFELSF